MANENGTPAKWNYRIVQTTDYSHGDQESDDPNEHVQDYRVIAVYYDEETDKILTSSDPEQAILVASSVDNLRPLVHTLMQALEHPVLNTCDLPGSEDYVDPDEREVLTETFYSAGKAYPVGGPTDPLFAPMDEGAIAEASDKDGGPIAPGNPNKAATDFSKATATESDDRQPELHTAGPGPDENPDDKDPAELDRDDNVDTGGDDGSSEAVHDDKQ